VKLSQQMKSKFPLTAAPVCKIKKMNMTDYLRHIFPRSFIFLVFSYFIFVNATIIPKMLIMLSTYINY